MPGQCWVRVRTIVVFLLLLIAIVCVLPVAAAETITVGPPNWQYSDIQTAIDAASQGDTIEVHWGMDMSYEAGESGILVDKSLNIIGIDTGYGLPVIYLGYSRD